jgi:hypothetical protein
MLRLPMIALALAATELIYQFVRLVQGAGSFGEALSVLKDVAVEVFARIGSALQALKYAFYQAAFSAQAAFLDAFAGIIQGASEMVSSVSGMIGQKFSDALGLNSAIGGLSELSAGLKRTAADARMNSDAYDGFKDNSIFDASQPIASVAKLREALDNAKGGAIDLRDVFGGAGAGEDESTVGGAASGAAKKAKESIDWAARGTAEWVNHVRDLGRGFGDSIGDGLMSIVDGTKSAREGFRDMAADIIKQLYDILVVQRIVAAATQAISGKAGTSGTGILGGLLGRIGYTPPVQARANGGPVTAGMPYMVGENGRELFIPDRGGRIDPNPRGDGGGVVVNLTMNVSTGVKETVRAELAALAPEIARQSASAVESARRRGKAA